MLQEFHRPNILLSPFRRAIYMRLLDGKRLESIMEISKHKSGIVHASNMLSQGSVAVQVSEKNKE